MLDVLYFFFLNPTYNTKTANGQLKEVFVIVVVCIFLFLKEIGMTVLNDSHNSTIVVQLEHLV